MLAFSGFGSWEEGIIANFDYLNKWYHSAPANNPTQSGSDIEFGASNGSMGPYCATNCEEYAGNVNGVIQDIQSIYVDHLLGYEAPPTTPNHVTEVAIAQIGKPYVYGAVGPDSFDCSGLVTYSYMNGAGKCLPRTSYDQAGCGVAVPLDQLQPGDIIGFREWGHVGIYIGNGQFIQAPQSGDVVKVTNLSDRQDVCGARRI
jgi:hypothetical protein